MKVPSAYPFLYVLGAAVGLNAQMAEVCVSELPYKYDSGATGGAVSTTVAHDGAPWIQLDLSETDLAPNAQLVLTGTSSTETLTADALANGDGWSAVFDGDSVDVQLVTKGNVFRGGNPSRVVVSAIRAGVCDDQPPSSICGTIDDRVPSTDVRVGRIGGCTGWLIAEDVFLQAGHCGAPSSGTRIHFTYGTGNAPTEDQYAVVPGSYMSSDDFPSGTKYGHDFGIGRLLPNSQTGKLPGVAQGEKCGTAGCGWFGLGNVPASVGGVTMRVTGYGTAAVDSRSQKTHDGDLVEIAENAGAEQFYLRYAMDTTGGNSGSPAIDESTGLAIGIHTHGGCSETGGANSCTRIDHPRLAPLIDFYLIDCTADADCDDSQASNGVETCVSGECQWGVAPTMAPTSCDTGVYLRFDITTDNYPLETSYTATDTCATQRQVADVPSGSFAATNTAYTNNHCVSPNSAFTFTIRDTYDDGICCGYGNGSYEVTYEGQAYVGSLGGAFGSSETFSIGTCGGPATPNPTKEPTPAPTPSPTPSPTSAPVPSGPTPPPTPAPTNAPTRAPTDAPTLSPTPAPTPSPTPAPTPSPTDAPVTPPPSPAPTPSPTPAPVTFSCSIYGGGGECKRDSRCAWSKGSCVSAR